MSRYRPCLAVIFAMLVVASGADAKIWKKSGLRLGEDAPARIIVLQPDVQVGSMGIGGVDEANADWTAAARARLATQIEKRQRMLGNAVVFLPDQEGDRAKLIADYLALLRTVVATAATREFDEGGVSPGRRAGAEWTLGPGAAQIGAIGGGDYALYVWTRDSFGTGGRKVFRLLTGQVASTILEGSGVHRAYAVLIDLASGDLVWFNEDPRAGGDPRTDDGAAKRIGQLFNAFPLARRVR